MNITLPSAVENFLRAANAHDADAVAACFSESGAVRDEGQVHSGRDAIHAWSSKTSADYAVTSTVVGFVPTALGGVVAAEVAGNFPGSPLRLSFNFTLDNDAINTLEITA